MISVVGGDCTLAKARPVVYCYAHFALLDLGSNQTAKQAKKAIKFSLLEDQ